MHWPTVNVFFPSINLTVIYHIFKPHQTSCLPLVAHYKWDAGLRVVHPTLNRLIHPYIVKCNAAVRGKRVGPLHVRATLWQEKDEEMEITCYTTASQRWNGTGRTIWEEWFRARTSRSPGDEIKVLWEQSTRQRGRPPSVRPSCGSHRGCGPGEQG